MVNAKFRVRDRLRLSRRPTIEAGWSPRRVGHSSVSGKDKSRLSSTIRAPFAFLFGYWLPPWGEFVISQAFQNNLVAKIYHHYTISLKLSFAANWSVTWRTLHKPHYKLLSSKLPAQAISHCTSHLIQKNTILMPVSVWRSFQNFVDEGVKSHKRLFWDSWRDFKKTETTQTMIHIFINLVNHNAWVIISLFDEVVTWIRTFRHRNGQ